MAFTGKHNNKPDDASGWLLEVNTTNLMRACMAFRGKHNKPDDACMAFRGKHNKPDDASGWLLEVNITNLMMHLEGF